ncbi:hypothetical protein EV368DRAFT_62444 [Lentinula lateritia]|nr:hypothetical protein EV368DRAFT_62444 [Lentinula lateritia]KAJ3893570.1 hypothetical protein GG344DRAFT_63697 [Lentinula edodes]
MRSKHAKVLHKSRSQSAARALRPPIFGPPSPPSRTYRRNVRNLSPSDTPSRYCSLPGASTSSTLLRSRSPPVALYSTSSNYRVYDYEEPVLNSETPSNLSTPIPFPPLDTSPLDSSPLRKAEELTVDPINADEPILLGILTSLVYQNPSGSLSPREIETSQILCQAREDLRKALHDAQSAKDKVNFLQEAEEGRNNCPCCLQVNFQPFILSCGHTCCKECLVTLADLYMKAKMNFACPDCRAIQGCFTPIPNYALQRSVDDMLGTKGLKAPSRQPLRWPLEFQSGPTLLAFPPSNATYPTGVPAAVAPFPLVIEDD